MNTNSRGTVLATVVAVLIAITLLAIGFSRHESKAAAANPSPNISVPTQAAVTPPPSVPEQPSKKTVKKRSATVTYSDKTYGLSFRYPRKYSLKSGDAAQAELADLGPAPLNFVQPGGTTVVSVEMPQASYPKTDLSAALLNVNVHRSITPEECSQFALGRNADEQPVQSQKVKVGEREFDEMEAIGEQGKAQADARYYHVFENGACYEFALALGTADTSEIEGISPVNRDAVFARLEKILSTVKIDSGSDVSMKATTTAENKQ